MFTEEWKRLALLVLTLLICGCSTREKAGRQYQTATSFDELFHHSTARDVDALIGACSDGDSMIRRIALASLVEIGDKRSAEQLRRSLMDPDDFAREAAAHGLGVLKDLEAVATLKKMLDDKSVEVRNASAWALAQMKQLEDAMVERLGADRDPAKQAAVRLFNPVAQMKLIGEHDEAYGQHVMLWLSPTEPMVSDWAARSGREQVIKEVSVALEDESALVPSRLIAAHSLVALRANEAVPAVIRVVKQSKTWAVRLKCLAVIGALEDNNAVRPMIDLLNTTEDLRLKGHVANTLGYLGDRRAVPALMDALATPEYVGTRVIRPSIFDYQGNVAWRKLKKDVQVSAATALGRLGDPKAETILKVFADPAFRSELSKKRDPTKPVDVIYMAIDAAADADEEVRKAAGEALGRIAR
jgi:HEAT repeat protein